MKKTIITIAAAFILSMAGKAQSTTVLANFDFNESTSLPQNANTTASNITASINGTESDASYNGTATGSNAFVQNTTAGNAMSMSGNTNTNTWTLTMGGSNLYLYASYKLYFQAQRSSTGATTITLSYSTDGTNFTNVSTTASPGNGSFAEATIDMSNITAINNPSALYIKFTGSGSTNNGGTLRMDNLEIQGTESASGTNGNNTFFNGNVGIGTNNPAYPLDVVGAARISGALTSGATTVSSLSNSGATTLTGAVSTGALTSGATTVSSLSSSGNLSVTGTTALTGAVSTGALTSGATTVSGLTNTGNLTTAGTFAATGAATLSNNLSVAGTTNLTGAVTTGALTSGATNVSSLSSSGNISTSGVLSAATLSVTGGASFDSLDAGQSLTFGNRQATISLTPINPTNHTPNHIIIGPHITPTLPPCLFPSVAPSWITDFTDGIQINSNPTSGNTILSMVYDGINHSIDGSGLSAKTSVRPALLLNYYCGNDVYIGTGTTGSGNNINGGGVVQTGGNLEVGAVTRNTQIALNLKSYGTTAMNLANSSNQSIFSVVATDGSVIIPNLPTTTTSSGTTFSSVLVDNTGKLISSAALVGALGSPWQLGGNSHTGNQPLGTLTAGDDLPIVTSGIERMRIMATGNVVANSGTQMSKVVFGSAYTSSLNYGTSYVGLNAQRDPVSGNWTTYSDNANNGGSIMFGDVGGSFHFCPMPDKNPSSGNATWSDADILSHLTMSIDWNTTTNAGQVFIGAKKPTYSNHDGSALSVFGDITTTALYVTDPNPANNKWADFVFDNNYKLMPLNELENFYKQNHHLPSVPTTKDIQEKGNNLGETEVILLQKIEELTLYVVQQQKTLEKQQQEIAELKKKQNNK